MKWPFVSRKRFDALVETLDSTRRLHLLETGSMFHTLALRFQDAQEQTASVEATLKAMTEDRNKWRDKAAKYKSHIERLEARIEEQSDN